MFDKYHILQESGLIAYVSSRDLLLEGWLISAWFIKFFWRNAQGWLLSSIHERSSFAIYNTSSYRQTVIVESRYKCMTSKYLRILEPRYNIPRRDAEEYYRKRHFYGIFLTMLGRILDAAYFSTRLKLSDVYRFSQWRFIFARKVFRGGYSTLPCCIPFAPPYEMLP